MTMQGSELKAIREALGWGQRKFADEIGMTQTFIGMMERGERPIEPRTALAAKYLFDRKSTFRQLMPAVDGLPTPADMANWQATFEDLVPGGNSADFVGLELSHDGLLWAICRLKRKKLP